MSFPPTLDEFSKSYYFFLNKKSGWENYDCRN